MWTDKCECSLSLKYIALRRTWSRRSEISINGARCSYRRLCIAVHYSNHDDDDDDFDDNRSMQKRHTLPSRFTTKASIKGQNWGTKNQREKRRQNADEVAFSSRKRSENCST